MISFPNIRNDFLPWCEIMEPGVSGHGAEGDGEAAARHRLSLAGGHSVSADSRPRWLSLPSFAPLLAVVQDEGQVRTTSRPRPAPRALYPGLSLGARPLLPGSARLPRAGQRGPALGTKTPGGHTCGSGLRLLMGVFTVRLPSDRHNPALTAGTQFRLKGVPGVVPKRAHLSCLSVAHTPWPLPSAPAALELPPRPGRKAQAP